MKIGKHWIKACGPEQCHLLRLSLLTSGNWDPTRMPQSMSPCKKVTMPKFYYKHFSLFFIIFHYEHFCIHKLYIFYFHLLTLHQWQLDLSFYNSLYKSIKITNRFEFSIEGVLVLIAEQKTYRLVFLVLGMMLLLLAPLVCTWVPFYYSSAMTLGIILVVLILLFQVHSLFYNFSLFDDETKRYEKNIAPNLNKSSSWNLLFNLSYNIQVFYFYKFTRRKLYI